MLSRLLLKSSSHFRLLSHLSSKYQPCPLSPGNPNFSFLLRPLSTNHNNNSGNDRSTSDVWKLSRESDEKFDSLFTEDSNKSSLGGLSDSPAVEEGSWLREKSEGLSGGGIFEGIEKGIEGGTDGGGGGGGGSGNEWLTSSDVYKPWSLGEEEEEKDVFDFGESIAGDASEPMGEISESVESESNQEGKQLQREEENKKLEREEKELTAILKGPNRAFGDLIAASGITDEMLDSLIALKDFDGIDGLPPLSEIEDIRYKKSTKEFKRYEKEKEKWEEEVVERVRQVDDKGRAYGTGKRKCSIARVWVQPGDGKFVVNDKQFDVYFPMLDHRATLLRPFVETKTLGLWDVNCTVKGGGVSGQVGAIQLGISRALQNWEPDLRRPLRQGGFLTRDSRVVERKKPGKAKARKSFPLVKR